MADSSRGRKRRSSHPENRFRDIYGLVLTGGESRRFGGDKTSFHFRNSHVPLYQEVAYRLENCLERVFVSQRQFQSRSGSVLSDKFSGRGPIVGILSAFSQFPHKAWMVVAGDMPFVTTDTILGILENREASKLATTYVVNQYPEPLCTLYEPRSAPLLRSRYAQGAKSLSSFLKEEDCQYVPGRSSEELLSLNTKQAWAEKQGAPVEI